MTNVKTLADLQRMRDRLQQELNTRTKEDAHENPVVVRVAMATCGIASGSRQIMEFFIEQMERRNIDGTVIPTGCMGYCYAEPTVEITLPGNDPMVFGYVDEKKADEIIERYIKNGELIDGLIPVNYETIESKA